MWNMWNTEGFTQAQLDVINAVIERLMAGNVGLDDLAVNVAISNEWREGMTGNELYKAVVRRLGLTPVEKI